MSKRDLAVKQLNELKKRIIAKRLAAEGWNSEYKTLISTILSARTRDDKTIEIATILYRKYPNVKSLSKANLRDIEKIIRSVNFYRNKSKNIINCAKQIVNEYNGKIPHDFDKLTKLSGVGRKTANVFLAVYGHAKIGVDTHVLYISQKIGWTKNRKPELIERDLENLFPKSKWRSINWTLVGFGRSYSRSRQDEIIGKLKKMRYLKII